jgi:hypothetical protein
VTHTRIIVTRYGEPDALQVVKEKEKGEYKGGRNHFPARGGPAEFVVRPSYLVDRKKGSPWITRYASRFTSDALSPSQLPHHIRSDEYASDFALD